MAINNPAARLHNILTLCRKNELGSKPMLQSWGAVLSLDAKTEEILVVSKIGKVFSLPSRITSEIAQFDDLDQRLYLGWKPDLSKAFQNVRFDTNFGHFSSKLSDSLLINIEFCAHELSKRRPEKIVDPERLGELKELAYKLYNDVMAAKLDITVSRYLLDHLIMIIDAIDDYLITGAAGLETSLEAAVGSTITQSDFASMAKKSVFGEPFWNVVGRIALVLNLAKTAIQLGEGVGKWIGE